MNYEGPIFTLAAGGDRDIELWHPIQREAIATLRGHTDPVSSLAFSANGKAIAMT